MLAALYLAKLARVCFRVDLPAMLRIVILLFALLFTFASTAVSLRIVTEDLPPLHSLNEQQQVSGPLIDIVKALLKEANMEAEIEVYPWTISYQLALHEPNTLIFSMLRNKERENKFHWIGKLYRLDSYLVALKSRDDITINTIEDAKKYSIASIRHDLAASYLIKQGFVTDQNLYLSDKYPHLWNLLYKKRVDLAFTNSLIWRYEIEKTGLDPQQISLLYQIPDFASDLYLAASLSTSDEDVEVLRAALAQLKQDGRYQSILAKWKI